MSLTRRQLLRAAGGATLALPLLQVPARGQDGPAPKRLLVFYTPNGTKKELWSPPMGASESQWSLGPLLEPLTPFKSKLVVTDGIEMTVAGEGPGGPHQRGMASLLTGAVITEGDFVGGDGRRAGWGGGLSIDQHVARQLDAGTPFPTVELGVRVLENVPRGRIIYGGTEQPIPPENDPVNAYRRLFGQQEMSSEEAQRRLLRRRSVLDAVHANFTRLRGKLARVDVEKLDRHANALRDLERRLGALARSPHACGGEAPAEVDDVMSEAVFREILRAQMDLMVAAFACDITQVGSIQCSTSVNALRFTFMEELAADEGHALSHAGDSNEVKQDRWERMLRWFSEQFAYLLQKLDGVQEGAGTMLDNTLVVWVNEISRGNTHAHTNMPFLLAGGAGGALRTDRYLKYAGDPHNNLLVSIMNMMGVEGSVFGDPRFCSGPLSGLA